MKVGDIVKADDWVADVKSGVIVKIDPPTSFHRLRTARVRIGADVYIIRTCNLEVINESG